MEYNNQEIIQRYERYLKNKKQLNEYTIRNYMYDLKSYDIFLNGKHFFDATEQDIKKYIQDKIDRGNSDSRINFSIVVLSAFYKYLVRNNYLTRNNPMKNISKLKVKKVEKEKEYLTTYQVYEIRRRLRELDNVQLEVFFGILISSAPMKQCISKIEWRKINWKEKYIEVEINDKERCILYLDDYTIDRLTELRKERKNKNIKRKWVFLTRHNGNWSSICDATISYWLNKIKDTIGVDKLTFSIIKESMKYYSKIGRCMSDEKINKILEHRSWELEFRQDILKEVEKVLQMK